MISVHSKIREGLRAEQVNLAREGPPPAVLVSGLKRLRKSWEGHGFIRAVHDTAMPGSSRWGTSLPSSRFSYAQINDALSGFRGCVRTRSWKGMASAVL